MEMISRRTAFSAVAGVAAASATMMLATPAGAAAFASKPISPALAAAMHRHRQARARTNRFDRDIHRPALAAARAAIEAVPHQRVATAFTDMAGDDVRLSTESKAHVAMAMRTVADPGRLAASGKAWVRALGELAALARDRDARIEAIKQEHRLLQLRARELDLGSREYAALLAVIETPAAHMRDLLAKVLFVHREDEVNDDAIQAIASDIRRLGGEA
ncbi:hypothetical protein [Sphingomonas aquatilis]